MVFNILESTLKLCELHFVTYWSCMTIVHETQTEVTQLIPS